jgi:hypothetical protein
MIFIGRLGGGPHDDQRHDVVHRVRGGMDRVAEDGERAGREADDQFGPHDRQIGEKDAPEHAADRVGSG